MDDRRGHARQPRDVNAVRAIRPSRRHPVQKNHVLPLFDHRQVEVTDVREMLFHLDELVVVRGEQGARPALRVIVKIFYHSPRNCHPVIGARAAPDLVQNQQALRCGVIENRGRFHHLHHECGLSRRQLVGGTDAREDAIRYADLRRVRRHKTADLRHQHDECALTKEH
ncbi:MAG: hypothetical protein BWY25_01690 [Chloroflexi bacterium ADurb.Bin222]|nr:MAG: hypothetical protein BWY25_01690 [Chloroflexi bacterium ADurb.Bin222]